MEFRFSELLNPIRDLARNWDIDVASSLEEYLDELSQLRFSNIPGSEGGTLNFAEAALVIQGSAAVYSKKVEYLHALVFQALNQISVPSTTRVRIYEILDFLMWLYILIWLILSGETSTRQLKFRSQRGVYVRLGRPRAVTSR